MPQLGYNNAAIAYNPLNHGPFLPSPSECFNKFWQGILNDIVYKIVMRDANFFLRPKHEWQRRYEAIHASFVDCLPAKVVADKFGYSPGYVHLLRHQFTHEKIDFAELVPEGRTARRRVDSKLRNILDVLD